MEYLAKNFNIFGSYVQFLWKTHRKFVYHFAQKRRQSRRRFGIIYPEQKEPSRTPKTQQGERKRIMAIKIGINGFGRIGRVVLRILAEDPEQYEICGGMMPERPI